MSDFSVGLALCFISPILINLAGPGKHVQDEDNQRKISSTQEQLAIRHATLHARLFVRVTNKSKTCQPSCMSVDRANPMEQSI